MRKKLYILIPVGLLVIALVALNFDALKRLFMSNADEPGVFRSNDGATVLRVEERADAAGLAVVITHDGQKTLPLALDEAVLEVTNAHFLPDGSVGVSGKIDETTAAHAVFDVATGVSRKMLHGQSFCYDSRGNLYYVATEVSDGDARDKIAMNDGIVVYDPGAGKLFAESMFVENDVLFFEVSGVINSMAVWRYGIKLPNTGPGVTEVTLGPAGKPLPSNERVPFTSADGAMDVYVDSIDASRPNPVAVALMVDGQAVVVPLDASATAVLNVQFLPGGKAGIEGHITPDVSSYEIFDVQTGKAFESVRGHGFIHDGTGMLYYIEGIAAGEQRVLNGAGKVFYETAENEMIRDNLCVEEGKLYFSVFDLVTGADASVGRPIQ